VDACVDAHTPVIHYHAVDDVLVVLH
jgi:hypothetical protein